jgi:HEAT repeat protein
MRPEDFNRLLRIYQDSREAPEIRGQAAEALTGRVDYRESPGRMRRRDALARQAFLRGLDDPEAEVRLWSIFALANRENGWLVSRLESMTSDAALVPGMYTVGQEARWAIRWIRGEEHIDPEEL